MTIDNDVIYSNFYAYLEDFKPKTSHNTALQLSADPNARSIITGVENAYYNCIFLTPQVDISILCEELKDLQTDLKLPFSVWTQNGVKLPELSHFTTSPGDFYGMCLDITQATIPQTSEKIQIKEISNHAEALAATDIFCECFMHHRIKEKVEAYLLESINTQNTHTLHYLAMMDDKPVGYASLVLDKRFKQFKTAGFYNACVTADARNSGVGTAMAIHRLNIAKAHDIDTISIILMSDAMARGYCQRIGFKDYNVVTPFILSDNRC